MPETLKKPLYMKDFVLTFCYGSGSMGSTVKPVALKGVFSEK
jgi:hypothetical protein